MKWKRWPCDSMLNSAPMVDPDAEDVPGGKHLVDVVEGIEEVERHRDLGNALDEGVDHQLRRRLAAIGGIVVDVEVPPLVHVRNALPRLGQLDDSHFVEERADDGGLTVGGDGEIVKKLELAALVVPALDRLLHQGELHAGRVERHRDVLRMKRQFLEKLQRVDALLVMLRFKVADDDEIGLDDGDAALFHLADEARGMGRGDLIDGRGAVDPRIQEPAQLLVFGPKAQCIDEPVILLGESPGHFPRSLFYYLLLRTRSTSGTVTRFPVRLP